MTVKKLLLALVTCITLGVEGAFTPLQLRGRAAAWNGISVGRHLRRHEVEILTTEALGDHPIGLPWEPFMPSAWDPTVDDADGLYASGAEVQVEDHAYYGAVVTGLRFRYDYIDNWGDSKKRQTVTLFQSYYGSWKGMKECPEDKFINGFWMESNGDWLIRSDRFWTGLHLFCREKAQRYNYNTFVELLDSSVVYDWRLSWDYSEDKFVKRVSIAKERVAGGWFSLSDPIVGLRLEIEPPQNGYSQLSAKGQWVGLTSGGLPTSTARRGIYRTDGLERTTETNFAIAAKAKGTLLFVGGWGSLEVKTRYSKKIVESTLSRISSKNENEVTVSCPIEPGSDEGKVWAMFQWKVFSEEDQFGPGIDAETTDVRCTDSPTMEPKCPLEYCSDVQCQTCSYMAREFIKTRVPAKIESWSRTTTIEVGHDKHIRFFIKDQFDELFLEPVRVFARAVKGGTIRDTDKVIDVSSGDSGCTKKMPTLKGQFCVVFTPYSTDVPQEAEVKVYIGVEEVITHVKFQVVPFVDHCTPNPCGPGRCIDGNGGYRCDCSDEGEPISLWDSNCDDYYLQESKELTFLPLGPPPDSTEEGPGVIPPVHVGNLKSMYFRILDQYDQPYKLNATVDFIVLQGGAIVESYETVTVPNDYMPYGDGIVYTIFEAGYEPQQAIVEARIGTEVSLQHEFNVSPSPAGCGTDPCAHGSCSDSPDGYSCDCDSGFGGEDCDVNITNTCADSESPCSEHGTCANSADGYVCGCDEGWAGDTCARVHACAESPCGEHGSCSETEEGDSFVCTCEEGWAGDRCETVKCGNNWLLWLLQILFGWNLGWLFGFKFCQL